ncbi:30S ribosomal protein S6 [Pseudobdellovibrio exovorus]|uniref:Small ribosomal subunit protein bS6 n=1 Tax=Pseudobdellovibrio exovorus JSS TaxID=1184267 RepID=M4V737_9BACT|nr:30S ribosomal protein S6 [Pseudobdellovibrio exovorus]AGH94250.1 30S ribosomal protein S6 [Pseudobdellovibrio exovorus JSS]
MDLKAELKRPYEVVILVHPDATVEEQKALFTKNKATIENYKGSIHSLETWGKRTLATPIGKLRKAVYFHAFFEADPQAIIELERTMRINDKVLRFMHTKLDERTPLAKHAESFKKGLAESAQREKEREAKAQLRRQAAQQARSEKFEKYDKEEA